MLKTISDRGVDDTRLRWTDPRGYLIELEEEVEVADKELRAYAKMNPNDMAGYQNGYKVKDLTKWAKKSIDRNLQLMAKINKAVEEHKQVLCFDVDYHDDSLNSIVRDQIESGTLELIEEDN
jgi:hypothetical protein